MCVGGFNFSRSGPGGLRYNAKARARLELNQTVNGKLIVIAAGLTQRAAFGQRQIHAPPDAIACETLSCSALPPSNERPKQ